MKKRTVTWYKKKLDKIFSQYIRVKASSWEGYAQCVTCKVIKPWKELQSGHYISRSHNATRYLEENCHCQCVGCNVFKAGNMDEYALYIIETYGIKKLRELKALKNEIKQFTTMDLEEMIIIYQKKLKKEQGSKL